MPRQVRVSPNGKHVAALSTDGARDFVVAKPTKGGQLRSLVSVVRDRFGPADTLTSVGWASNDTLVVRLEGPRLQSRVNSRKARYLVVALDGSRVDHIDERWPENKRTYVASIVSYLPRDPNHFLLNLRFVGATYPTPRRVDLKTGAFGTEESDIWGIWRWHVDHRDRIRAAEGAAKPRGGIKEGRLENVLLARSNPAAELKEVIRWDPFEEDGVGFAGFGRSPNEIYVYAPTEPGARHAIYEFDVKTRTRGRLVFQHPDVDASSVVSSRVGGRPLWIPYTTDRPHRHFLDPEWKRIHDMLDQVLPNRTNRIVSRSLDEKVLIVRSSSDVVPPEYYILDRNEMSLALLVESHAELDGVQLAPMKPISYEARDGLTIHGYLTRPAGSGTKPLPTIVFPHGGPFARDVWGWDGVVQFFASRGFAVFQPNFRGSDGYGEDFEQKGWGEWGLAMQDDITDGVRWLIDEKLADPNRVGIFGISYGGYAALQGLVRTPDLYKAGASFAGVSDIRLLLSEDKIRFLHDDWHVRLIGDRRQDRAKLDAASPVHNVDKIRVPVLLGHGTRDNRVDPSQSETMARALRKRKSPVELYIYDDELHGFVNDANAADFYTKLANFFERHL
jgi:dipeptidyl aminopeptidase/acylaminoacyl peptidase